MARTFDRVPPGFHRDARPEPSSIIRKLRFVASCALGGALLTGVALGHDVSGFDPRIAGAVFGLAIGLVSAVRSGI